MLINSFYLQECHHVFVNIDFIQNDVNLAMIKLYFLVVIDQS